MEEDERVHESRRGEAQKVSEEVLQIQAMPEDVPEMYERGLARLAGLNGLKANVDGGKKQSSLTETVGKVQRARRVVGELE